MSGIQKGFKVDDRVVIVETGDSELNGKLGTILGTSFDVICKCHIVLLDVPYKGEKAISITEACLDKQ